MLFENIINGVYVELDCLFDTRLSMMYDIDKNVMSSMIELNSYHNRIIDQFGYISVKLFRILYSLRNANVLDNPMGTKINDLIKDYCIEATTTAKSLEDYNKINIYVNIYPYNLTEEDIELLRMGISNSLKVPVNVEILNKKYTEVTPAFMRDKIGLAVLYDAMLWIEHFTSNKQLINTSIPDTTMLTPTLLHRNVLISKKELNKFFEDIEKSVAMLVQLIYLPTEMFCFRKEKNK